MTEGQFEERLKRLETMYERMYLKIMGEEAPAPPKPFVEEPWQPIDWSARMSMPASAMAEMAKVGCGDPRADAAALSAGRGMVKQGPSKDPGQQRAIGERGWIEPKPLAHHGQRYADTVIDGIGGAGKGAK
jgi:hypothetical protein